MSEKIIKFNNVSKRYQIISRGYRSLGDDLGKVMKQFLPFLSSKKRHIERNNYIWALKNVNFEVKRGEVLGIVGPNGAGKTTILKILAGITWPTKGSIIVKGRVAALIELTAGFHPELTGRENIYLSGSIMGFKKKEIDRKFDSIVEFSEIEKFLDTPVKKYSSGMLVRLGFSIAIHCEPEILLVDEILAVGDYMFRDKCAKKMKEFLNSGIPMVIVAHHRHILEKICTKAILLKNGEIICSGQTKEVLDEYFAGSVGGTSTQVLIQREDKIKPIEIKGISILGENGKEKRNFLTREEMKVRIYFKTNTRVQDPCFYCRICRDDTILHGTSTGRFNIRASFESGKDGFAEIRYKALNLLEGEYYLNIGILRDFFSDLTYDAIDKAFFFTISGRIDEGGGVVFLENQWRIGNYKRDH